MSDGFHNSRKATSFDVARLAGVSRAAVSRTYTPDASVSPETREKVHKAAAELGYRVNYLARSLTNSRSDLVGVIVAGFDNPFRALQVEQIAYALLARNLRPMLLPTSMNADTPQLIGQLLHYAVSGVVVTSDAPPSSLCEECAAHGVPIVLINKGDEIDFVDRVITDDLTAGTTAASYLIERGARRPAVMGAAKVSYTVRRRISAFVARCAALGVEATLRPIALNDYQSGFAAAEGLADYGIDALFCTTDYLACGVIDRLAADRPQSKSRLPIIGHDNIPQASWAAYDITTFLQPCDLQARLVVELLISRIGEPKTSARVEVTPVTLIMRGSA
ncbi:MAG: LacI family DNA-binding transcriptional regulator [Pseudorhodobacter sp.]|nr:LacI family DNA-binding transcriptional regulator [Pseudorhodobacter sp.]